MDKPNLELMTPEEAARWFRRSPSWLRRRGDLVRLGPRGQPLYHVCVCRAYVLGRMQGVRGEALRRMQLDALAQLSQIGKMWRDFAALAWAPRPISGPKRL